MAIRAVVFDIGGVLEITPDLGVTRLWEARLGLADGGLDERMRDTWVGGSTARSPRTTCTRPSGNASAWTSAS